MGNSNTIVETNRHPCGAVLETYIKCMEKHEGTRPDPYEPEFCHLERDQYLDCRQSLKKEEGGTGGD